MLWFYLKYNYVYLSNAIFKLSKSSNLNEHQMKCASSLELMNKNVITRLKSQKTLEQLSSLFGTKYAKKFDFEGKLSDFLTKDIVPVVKKRISRYNKIPFNE